MMSRPSTITRLFLIILCAAMAFGGTFTCSSGGSSSDKITETLPRPAR